MCSYAELVDLWEDIISFSSFSSSSSSLSLLLSLSFNFLKVKFNFGIEYFVFVLISLFSLIEFNVCVKLLIWCVIIVSYLIDSSNLLSFNDVNNKSFLFIFLNIYNWFFIRGDENNIFINFES